MQCFILFGKNFLLWPSYIVQLCMLPPDKEKIFNSLLDRTMLITNASKPTLILYAICRHTNIYNYLIIVVYYINTAHIRISNIITYHFSFFHLIALSTAYVDSGGFPIHCCNPIVFGICYLLSFSVRQMLLALRYLAL